MSSFLFLILSCLYQFNIFCFILLLVLQMRILTSKDNRYDATKIERRVNETRNQAEQQAEKSRLAKSIEGGRETKYLIYNRGRKSE